MKSLIITLTLLGLMGCDADEETRKHTIDHSAATVSENRLESLGCHFVYGPKEQTFSGIDLDCGYYQNRLEDYSQYLALNSYLEDSSDYLSTNPSSDHPRDSTRDIVSIKRAAVDLLLLNPESNSNEEAKRSLQDFNERRASLFKTDRVEYQDILAWDTAKDLAKHCGLVLKVDRQNLILGADPTSPPDQSCVASVLSDLKKQVDAPLTAKHLELFGPKGFAARLLIFLESGHWG